MPHSRRYRASVKWRGQVSAATGGVAFRVLRGVLLWLVVPVGFIWWLVAWPWFRSRRVRLGQLLGRVDLNLIATISRSLFRPLLGEPAFTADLPLCAEGVRRHMSSTCIGTSRINSRRSDTAPLVSFWLTDLIGPVCLAAVLGRQTPAAAS